MSAPRPLRIRAVAPAGPVAAGRLDAGLARLRALGHEVVEGRHARCVHGHLAGTDAQRAEDLMEALLDGQAHAVWAARGGFGGLRLLPLLDWEALAQVPLARRAPLIGYSDLTSLQNALASRLDWPCWHAPMLATELHSVQDPLTEASLAGLLAHLADGTAVVELAACLDAQGVWQVRESQAAPADSARVRLTAGGFQQILDLPPSCIWQGGQARGRSGGGNLSVLTSLYGGLGEPELDGRCLWLEDHGEYPFRLDRHLAQVANSEDLEQCAALLLGSFLDCGEPDPTKSTFTAEELLRAVARRVRGPVLWGLPFGHSAPRICIPFHGECAVDA